MNRYHKNLRLEGWNRSWLAYPDVIMNMVGSESFAQVYVSKTVANKCDVQTIIKIWLEIRRRNIFSKRCDYRDMRWDVYGGGRHLHCWVFEVHRSTCYVLLTGCPHILTAHNAAPSCGLDRRTLHCDKHHRFCNSYLWFVRLLKNSCTCTYMYVHAVALL